MNNTVQIFSLNIDNKIFSVLKPINQQDAKVLNARIKITADKKFVTDFEFCKWLYHAKNTFVGTKDSSVPFYEHCGYKSWEDFCEKNLCITGRKARKYISVYEKYAIDLKDIFDEKKHVIEISKMISLLPLVNDYNLTKIIEKARYISTKDFTKLTTPKHLIGKKGVMLWVPNNDLKIRDDAFNKASKQFGSELTDGELFVKICSSYLKK